MLKWKLGPLLTLHCTLRRFVTGSYTSVTNSRTREIFSRRMPTCSWDSSPLTSFSIVGRFISLFSAMFRSDGTQLQTPLPACSTRTGFFSSCGSLERRWCVWERKRESRGKRREERGSNGSKPWWFHANAFQGQRWSESSRSDPAWRSMTRVLDGEGLALVVVRKENREWSETREGRKLYNLINGCPAVWRHHVAGWKYGFYAKSICFRTGLAKLKWYTLY